MLEVFGDRGDYLNPAFEAAFGYTVTVIAHMGYCYLFMISLEGPERDKKQISH